MAVEESKVILSSYRMSGEGGQPTAVPSQTRHPESWAHGRGACLCRARAFPETSEQGAGLCILGSEQGGSEPKVTLDRELYQKEETLFSREIRKRLGGTVHDHGGKLAKSGREQEGSLEYGESSSSSISAVGSGEGGSLASPCHFWQLGMSLITDAHSVGLFFKKRTQNY